MTCFWPRTSLAGNSNAVKHAQPRPYFAITLTNPGRTGGLVDLLFTTRPTSARVTLTMVAEIKTICDEFEVYGYRRVDAELRHRGIVVNAKKIRRARAMSSRGATASSRRRR
jgi:hypothetical protein